MTMHYRLINQPKESPYLTIGSILTVVGTIAIAAIGVALVLTSMIMLLTVAFILLKVLGAVTFGWGMVFSPMWIPILIALGSGTIIFIGGYLINVGIFVKRLCTGKIGS